MHPRVIKVITLGSVLLTVLFSSGNGQIKRIRQLQQALATSPDSLVYTDILNELANLYHYRHLDSIIYYADIAYGIAERHGYDRGIAGALTAKGYYYVNLNNYLSHKYSNDALRIYRQLGDSLSIALLVNNISIDILMDGEYEKGIAGLHEADRIARAAGKDSIRTFVCLNLIDFDTSISLIQRDSLLDVAYAISTRLNDDIMRSASEHYKGVLLFAAGRQEEAMSYYRDLANKTDTSNYVLQLFHYKRLAWMQLMSGKDTAGAIANLEKCLAIAVERKFNYASRSLIQILIDLYEATGNKEKQLYYAKLYLDQSAKSEAALRQSGFTYVNYVTNEHHLREAEARQNAQRKLILALIALIVVAAGLLFFVVRSRRLSQQKAKAEYELREKTEQRNRELEEWDQFHNMLLAVMAHDLRQPFAAIATATQSAEILGVFSRDDLLTILEELRHASLESMDFVEGLLSWINARKSNGQYVADIFSIETVVKGANAFFETPQQRKSVWLELDASLSGQYVYAEKNMLYFICRNILNNATKYAVPGKPITVRCYPEEQSLVTAITNFGKTMPEDELKALFQQGSGRPLQKDGLKGAGIAMIISNDMIHKMNGRIWAENADDMGVTFFFSLPHAVVSGLP